MEKRARWVIGISLGGLAVFGPGLYEWIRLSLQQRQLDQRLTELTREHERLTALEQQLRNDPTYVEGLIRTTFKVSQPGEIIIPLDGSSPSRKSN